MNKTQAHRVEGAREEPAGFLSFPYLLLCYFYFHSYFVLYLSYFGPFCGLKRVSRKVGHKISEPRSARLGIWLLTYKSKTQTAFRSDFDVSKPRKGQKTGGCAMEPWCQSMRDCCEQTKAATTSMKLAATDVLVLLPMHSRPSPTAAHAPFISHVHRRIQSSSKTIQRMSPTSKKRK